MFKKFFDRFKPKPKFDIKAYEHDFENKVKNLISETTILADSILEKSYSLEATGWESATEEDREKVAYSLDIFQIT